MDLRGPRTPRGLGDNVQSPFQPAALTELRRKLFAFSREKPRDRTSAASKKRCGTHRVKRRQRAASSRRRQRQNLYGHLCHHENAAARHLSESNGRGTESSRRAMGGRLAQTVSCCEDPCCHKRRFSERQPQAVCLEGRARRLGRHPDRAVVLC